MPKAKEQTQKSILEETFAEIASIKESLSNNASDLLNGDLKTELKNIVATAINEGNEFEEEELENTEDITPAGGENLPDIPSDDTQIDVSGEPEEDMAGDLPPTDASLTGDDAELPTDELPPMDGAEVGIEDDIVDLTGASDEEVLQVFKKMGPEDEIEVVQTPEGDIDVKLGDEQ